MKNFNWEIVIKKLVLRRFLEFLVLNIVLSVGISFLNQTGFIRAQKLLFLALLLGVLIYAAENLHLLKQCFFDLEDKKLYYISNYIAYLIFVIVNISIYFVCNSTVYAWLFSITKCARFSTMGISNFGSLMLFHLMMLGIIALAPVGMNWIFEAED